MSGERRDPRKLFDTIAARIDPGGADHQTLALLGHLKALADQQHEAILLLEAARSIPSVVGRTGSGEIRKSYYPGISSLLCRQYLRAGVLEKALQEARNAALGNLSTVRQQ